MASLPRPQQDTPEAIRLALSLAFDMIEHHEPWHRIGDKDQPGFQNAWVNFGGADEEAGFYKDVQGIVYLRGKIKAGTVGAINPAFTLPDGYRPRANLPFAVASNNAFGQLVVNATGDVIPATGSNVSFNLNVCFRAA